MKKALSLLVFSLLSFQSVAKGTEISLFSGYRAGGDLENADTGRKVSLDEGNSYGFIIGTDYGPNHVMEFLYSNQQTDLKNTGAPGTSAVLNLDVEYFQIGGSQIWSDKKIDKFFGATLGAIHLSPNNANLSSTSKFAMSLGGGMVFKISDNIGLRLELRSYFSALGSSETFCINNKCVVAGSGFMNQVDANAGLRIRF